MMFAILVTGATGSSGCKSAPKHEHAIQQIVLHNLHFRRPESKSAELVAEPGDEEYSSKPKPDERLDCRHYGELFKTLDLQNIRSCLTSLTRDASIPSVRFRLVRETQPYLELQEPETAPLCIKKSATRIPVPREIFYQAKNEGRVSCFSSRLDLSVDELIGYKVPTHRYEVVVDLPPAKVPRTDDETRMMLLTWAIQPFWDVDQHTLKAIVVPEPLCRKCMADSKRFTDLDTLPPQWP